MYRELYKKRREDEVRAVYDANDFFRRAVRAEGTRALLTGMVGMLIVLVNLLEL